MRISDWSSDVCSSDLLPLLDGRTLYQEYACRTTRSARSLRAGSSRAGAARAAREPESVTDTEAQPLAWSELLGRRFRLATVTLGLSIILPAVNLFVFATRAPQVVAGLGGTALLHRGN